MDFTKVTEPRKEYDDDVMIVRNRVIALVYRSAAFALLMTCFQFYWLGFPSFWISLSAFDIVMGIVMIVMFGMVIVFNLIDLRHGIHGVAAGPYMPIALPIMSLTTVTGIVYFAYSLPTGSAPNDFFASLYHVLLIVLPLLEWILFDEKGTVRPSAGFTFMLMPIFYYLFGYFRTLIWPNTPVYQSFNYGYPCLDFANPDIVLYSFIYFAVCLGAVELFIFLNNVFAGKFRRL